MATLDEFHGILALLPKLTIEQRAKIIQNCKGIDKMPIAKSSQETVKADDAEFDWLFHGIFSAMKQKGIASDQSKKDIYHTKGYKIYSKRAAQLRHDLDQLLPDESRAQGRASLAYLAGEALIKYVRARGKDATPGIVLTSASKILEAIELSFPGYRAANMLHIVIKGGF